MMNFPFGTNGKFIIFRCPNTKHIRVCTISFDIIAEGIGVFENLGHLPFIV